MKFIFQVLAKSPPAACIVGGIFLVTISAVAGLGGLLITLGILLILAGIGLQVLYLYRKY